MQRNNKLIAQLISIVYLFIDQLMTLMVQLPTLASGYTITLI